MGEWHKFTPWNQKVSNEFFRTKTCHEDIKNQPQTHTDLTDKKIKKEEGFSQWKSVAKQMFSFVPLCLGG